MVLGLVQFVVKYVSSSIEDLYFTEGGEEEGGERVKCESGPPKEDRMEHKNIYDENMQV